MGHGTVTSKFLETALRSGGSCQENKWILVKIHPHGKKDRTSGRRSKSDPRQKYLCEPARKSREIETCDWDLWQKRRVVKKIVSNGDLVSNLPHPRVKYKQLNSLDTPHPIPGHTYTHTRTPNTQGMKLPGVERGRQKERETRTQLAARLRESERKAHVIPISRNKF